MRKPILLLTVLTAALVPVSAERAMGQAELKCSVPREVIVTLPPSRLGIPTVWDATYGRDDKMIQFYAGVPLDKGTVLAYGRVLAKEDFKPDKTFLVEINRRRRVLSEQEWAAKTAEVPVDLMATKDGFLSASNIAAGKGLPDRWIRLSWYGKDAAFRKDQVWEDKEYHLDAQTLVPSSENDGGFVLVAHAINMKQDDDQHGVLMRFSSGGQLLWRHAYRPGIPNQLHTLMPLTGGEYLAAGRIRMEDGRRAGWIMKLGPDGAVLWQRTFPRGKASVITQALSYGDLAMNRGGYILLGHTEPSDGGPVAAWIMNLDAFGQIRWQRYLRRTDAGFMPAGLMREADGRLTVVINVLATEESGQRNHVRILTLAPEGAVIGDEAYIEGIEASAKSFMRGWNGERIVIATIESDTKPLAIEMIGDRFVVPKPPPDASGTEAPAPAKKGKPVQKGWISVAAALDPYEDPCK